MAMTLTATRYVDPTTGVVGTKLVVAGAAAAPSTLYASTFSAGLDGWALSSGTATVVNNTTDSPASLSVHVDTMGTDAVVSRTVGGLVVGQSYRFQADVYRDTGNVRLGISGGVNTGYLATDNYTWQTVTLDFTATAATHTITLTARAYTTWQYPSARFRNIKVTGPTGTWKGLRISRGDANGQGVWVRNPAGVDTVGGTATLYDYEPALVGTVNYQAVDGTNATASHNGRQIGATTDATWLSLPAKASTTSPYAPPAMDLFKVTAWTERQTTIGRTHQIIGRTDKVGNPGPLALRAGTFDVLGLTYDAVLELRQLLANGDVALLRQPTHKGLDLYFTVTDIDTRPDTDSLTWTATVSYEEVPRP